MKSFGSHSSLFEIFISDKARRFIDISKKIEPLDAFYSNNTAAMLSLLLLYNEQTGEPIDNIFSIHDFHALFLKHESNVNAQACIKKYKESSFYWIYQKYLEISKGMSDEQAIEENGWYLSNSISTLEELKYRLSLVDKKLFADVIEMDSRIDEYLKQLNERAFEGQSDDTLSEIKSAVNNYLYSGYTDKRRLRGAMMIKDKIESLRLSKKDKPPNVIGYGKNSVIHKIKDMIFNLSL